MHPDSAHPFQFNKQLDIGFLNDLFEGDTGYATIVFGDFLKDLPLYWSEVEDAYNHRNLMELKSAAHKCKTLFGYVGHTHVLEILQSFEHKCATVKSVDQLAGDFQFLQQKKQIAHQIIVEEYQRLKQFHQSA